MAPASLSNAVTRAFSASRSERPDAAEEIQNLPGLADAFRDERCQRLLARDGCLQERAWWQRHLGAAHPHCGRQALQHQLAMARQSRQAVLLGDARERGDERRRQRAGAADVDIEAVGGGGDLDVERLGHRHPRCQRLRQRPGGIERAIQPGIEDRATIDWNDVMRARRRETDLENVMRAEAAVQRDAPAPGAVGIDQRRDLAIDAGLRQRFHHDAALPGVIWLGRPMLDGAAAADAEMRAEWVDTLRACDVDREQLAAVGMVAHDVVDLDGLAAKRVGHVDRIARGKRDAVAAMADMVDGQALNHGARPGRIRYCRHRPQSRKGTPRCPCSRAKRQRRRCRRRSPGARRRRERSPSCCASCRPRIAA